ncbi:MAG: glycosyltransferase [Bacteroidota bacterium]
MQLSIIIPAYNEEKLLPKSIPKIQEAAEKAFDKEYAWEIILCDNASTDQTLAIARNFGLKVVSEFEHRIAKVRNTGAKSAQGDILLFIDADTYPDVSLLKELKAQISNTNFLGAGARIHIQGGSLWGKLRMERLNPLMKTFGYSWGAFLACRRDTFEAIGGFNEDLYALEEIDFVRRLKKYGRKQGLRFFMLEGKFSSYGRKDELGIRAFIRLFISNTAAVIFLLLHSILPKGWRPKANKKLFGFWYAR